MRGKKLTMAICDDDKMYVEVIHKFCKDFMEQETGDEIEWLFFPDGIEVLEYEKQIDILLLDIKMKSISGIEVKNRLFRKGADTKIIFLTNDTEYMREAFGKNVFGFVDKGKYSKDLRLALTCVMMDIYKELDDIIVEGNQKKIKLRLNDIYYIKASGNYLDIYTEKNKYYKRQKIGVCEETLKYKGFCRIQKSYIVNFHYIKVIKQSEVQLINGVHLPISRGTCHQIKKLYMDFLQKRV